MKRALICTQSNLTTDYRIYKMATTLRSAGYDVHFLSRSHPKEKRAESDDTHIMRLLFWHGPFFYAELNFRIWLHLIKGKKYDLVVSIDLDTLLGCVIGTKMKGERLMFDSHEYFPEVPEIVDKPLVKSVWNFVQDFCVPLLKGPCVTVCQSIADIFKQKYDQDFLVVRNVPLAERAEAIERQPKEDETFEILYQGAVNIGRGIEEMIEAMRNLYGCHFTVVGDGDILEDVKYLAKRLGVSDRVTFTGRKPFHELPQYMAKADLGLVLMKPISLNYTLALPNRIFDFIQAGVPILGSELPEIARIVKQEHVGVCIQTLTADDLRREITKIRLHPEKLETWRENMKRLAPQLTWENETEKLRELL